MSQFSKTIYILVTCLSLLVIYLLFFHPNSSTNKSKYLSSSSSCEKLARRNDQLVTNYLSNVQRSTLQYKELVWPRTAELIKRTIRPTCYDALIPSLDACSEEFNQQILNMRALFLDEMIDNSADISSINETIANSLCCIEYYQQECIKEASNRLSRMIIKFCDQIDVYTVNEILLNKRILKKKLKKEHIDNLFNKCEPSGSSEVSFYMNHLQCYDNIWKNWNFLRGLIICLLLVVVMIAFILSLYVFVMFSRSRRVKNQERY